MVWIANKEMRLDPNDSVIKRLRSNIHKRFVFLNTFSSSVDSLFSRL